MQTITGLFHDPERAMQALETLRAAGFGANDATIVASPTSAGIAAEQAVSRLGRDDEGFVDLGSTMGGQAAPGFPKEERLTYEERVAAGDMVVRVETSDHQRAAVASTILENAGADRVGPGLIRD